jgi:hypothetical protein
MDRMNRIKEKGSDHNNAFGRTDQEDLLRLNSSDYTVNPKDGHPLPMGNPC